MAVFQPTDRYNYATGPEVNKVGPGAAFSGSQVYDNNFAFHLNYNIYDEEPVTSLDAELLNVLGLNNSLGFSVEQTLETGHEDQVRSGGKVFVRHYTDFFRGESINKTPDYVELYHRVSNKNVVGENKSHPLYELYDDENAFGLALHRDWREPAWRPRIGYSLDTRFEQGTTDLGGDDSFKRIESSWASLYNLPKIIPWVGDVVLAYKLKGGYGDPQNGLHFDLGGPEGVRGFPYNEHEGSKLLLGCLECRFPLWNNMDKNILWRFIRIDRLDGVMFYDAGKTWLPHSDEHLEQSVGVGTRLYFSIAGFFERSVLRFDVAQATSEHESPTAWLGFQQAF